MYHQPVHGLWPLLLLCFTFDVFLFWKKLEKTSLGLVCLIADDNWRRQCAGYCFKVSTTHPFGNTGEAGSVCRGVSVAFARDGLHEDTASVGIMYLSFRRWLLVIFRTVNVRREVAPFHLAPRSTQPLRATQTHEFQNPVGAYLVHFSAHMDGLLAVFLAVLLPERPFFAVDEKVLDYFEKSEASWVLSVRGFAGFCRRNDGFKMLPTHGVTSPRGPGSINADGSGGSFGGPGLGGSGYIDTSGDVLGGGQSGSGVSPGHANVFGSAGGAGGENFMSDVVSGVSGVVMGTTAEALRVAPGVLKGGLGAMNVAMQNINQVTNAGVAVLSGSSSQMQAGASMAPGMAGAPAGASSGFTGNFVDTPEASSVLPPQAGAQPGTGPFPIPGPVPPPDTSASAAAAAGARHAAAAGPGVDLSGNASAAGGMTLDGDFDLNDPLENPGAGQANPAFLNAGGATVAPGVNLDLDI